MARALIVGCGCRGTALGARLAERGWEVRGTSRTDEGLARIEAAGIDPALADPERPGTVLELLGDAALVLWLLGSAGGEGNAIDAIHGPRLEALLARLVDTPVRGFAYEAVGSAGSERLERGAEIVAAAAGRWSIPVAILAEDPSGDWGGWGRRTAARLDALL